MRARDELYHRQHYHHDTSRLQQQRKHQQHQQQSLHQQHHHHHYYFFHHHLQQQFLSYFLLLLQLLTVDSMDPPYPEPVFLPRLLNVTAREGGKAVLPCAVHYLGTKQVTWRRMGDDHFLSVGDLTWVKDPNLNLQYNELTPEVTEWNLVIKKVTPEHSGTYECKISDKVKLIRYIHLDVVGPPLVETTTLPPIAISGKSYVERGQPIRLFCNTTGPDGTHLSIDWFKDGDRIDYAHYRQVIITNYNLVETNVLVSELLIDRSKASDTGTYICRSAGGYIDSIKVTVLFADTTNVKRGNPSSESSTSRPQCLLVVTILFAVIAHFYLVLIPTSQTRVILDSFTL